VPYESPWHTRAKGESLPKLLEACKLAQKDNEQRLSMSTTYCSLFEGCKMSTMLPVGYMRENSNVFAALKDQPLLRRKCRTTVKGAHALLWGNDDPLPMFKSVGGAWDTQTKARMLNRAIDAEYEQEQGRFDNTHDAWRHGGLIAMGVTGSMFLLALPGWGKVEARLHDTLTFGLETSGPNGTILGMVLTDYFEPEELALRFPKKRADIEKNAVQMHELGGESMKDEKKRSRWVVAVHMGYRSKIRDKDGRKTWILRDGTELFDQPYKYPGMPGVFWHFERELVGDWGLPLTSYIHQLALAQNRITNDCDQQQRNSPQRLIQGTKQAWEALGGKVKGAVFSESGSAATDLRVSEPPPFNSKSLELAQMYSDWIDQDSMVSQQHATGGAGKQGTSGIHEKYNASYFSEAFAPESRRIIHARTKATGRVYVWALKEMVDAGQDYKRKWERGAMSDEIDAKDLDLDDSGYLIQIASVSEEKNSPATLLDLGKEMLDRGDATLAEFTNFRQTLDLEALDEPITVEKQWLDRQVDKWLHAPLSKLHEDGFYQSPRKYFDDLVRVAETVQGKLLQAEGQGAPPERLEFFELFLEECAVLIEQEKSQAATSIAATAPAASIFPQGLGQPSDATGIPTAGGLPAAPGGGLPAPAPVAI
jgi:hypothetical protein